MFKLNSYYLYNIFLYLLRFFEFSKNFKKESGSNGALAIPSILSVKNFYGFLENQKKQGGSSRALHDHLSLHQKNIFHS